MRTSRLSGQSRWATDAFAQDDGQYSPRVDVGVYTIGGMPGNHYQDVREYWDANAPEALKAKVAELLSPGG